MYKICQIREILCSNWCLRFWNTYQKKIRRVHLVLFRVIYDSPLLPENHIHQWIHEQLWWLPLFKCHRIEVDQISANFDHETSQLKVSPSKLKIISSFKTGFQFSNATFCLQNIHMDNIYTMSTERTWTRAMNYMELHELHAFLLKMSLL